MNLFVSRSYSLSTISEMEQKITIRQGSSAKESMKSESFHCYLQVTAGSIGNIKWQGKSSMKCKLQDEQGSQIEFVDWDNKLNQELKDNCCVLFRNVEVCMSFRF